MKISGLLVLKQPNTINGKDSPTYHYTARGKNMAVFKTQLLHGESLYLCLCILFYHC